MNETRDVRTALTKILAIVGFFAIVGTLIWLLVQGLRVAPGSFSSLASIAETIQSYRPENELTIATEKTIVNSGDSFRVNWTDMETKGSYHFRYECIDGVRLSVRDAEGGEVDIACSYTLTLGDDVQGLFLTITSRDSRFVDVPFSVTFEKSSGGETVTSEATMTVVNATIPLEREEVVEEVTPEVSGVETERPVTPTPIPTPKPTTPAPKPTTPTTPGTPIVTEYSYTYYPVSDPKGTIDLAVKYLGIGTMSGNTFTPAGSFDNDIRGGLKFEVKNVGTKTSGNWTFTAVLPSGVTYTSDTQAPLKPNERVEFTLGFSLEDVKAGTVTLKVSVSEKTDTKKDNNSFSWAAVVTN